jgi:proteasome lid subunit RPN8/RPN11
MGRRRNRGRKVRVRLETENLPAVPAWRATEMSRKQIVLEPKAFLKLQFLCHSLPTEVGMFGLTDEQDPMRVRDFVLTKQRTTPVQVDFDDVGISDYHYEYGMTRQLSPDLYFAHWWHTHPGSSATPSGTDEETFSRVFAQRGWAVMGIMSRTGEFYARLRCSAGKGKPAACETADVVCDWAHLPALLGDPAALAAAVEGWREELKLVEVGRGWDWNPVLPDLGFMGPQIPDDYGGGVYIPDDATEEELDLYADSPWDTFDQWREERQREQQEEEVDRELNRKAHALLYRNRAGGERGKRIDLKEVTYADLEQQLGKRDSDSDAAGDAGI